MQVETSVRDLARMTDLRVASLYGGVGYGAQREAIKRGLDVIVATPGRLEDYLAQGALRLDNLKIVVLDEVDRMLDVGFLPAVKRILSRCPAKRQALWLASSRHPPETADSRHGRRQATQCGFEAGAWGDQYPQWSRRAGAAIGSRAEFDLLAIRRRCENTDLYHQCALRACICSCAQDRQETAQCQPCGCRSACQSHPKSAHRKPSPALNRAS